MSHIKFAGSTITTIPRVLELFISSFKLQAPQASVAGAEALRQTFNFTALVPASEPAFIAAVNPTQYQTAPRSEFMIRTTNQFAFNTLRDQNKEY